jgi:hypothetical protein
MHRSRSLGKSLLPPLHHHVLPLMRHAVRLSTPFLYDLEGSGKAELTLRSNNPFSRSAEVRTTASKYSTRLHLDERSGGSLSRRKSLPPVRWRNDVKHDGLLHLAAIAETHQKPNTARCELAETPDYLPIMHRLILRCAWLSTELSRRNRKLCPWFTNAATVQWRHGTIQAIHLLPDLTCRDLYPSIPARPVARMAAGKSTSPS